MQKLTMEFLRKVKVFAVGVLCIPQEVHLQQLQDWKFGSAAKNGPRKTAQDST